MAVLRSAPTRALARVSGTSEGGEGDPELRSGRMRETQDEVIPLHVPFEIVLRGFNRQQVLDHIESLEDRISVIASDRDTALRQVADLSKVLEYLRREAEEATERLARLQRSSLA